MDLKGKMINVVNEKGEPVARGVLEIVSKGKIILYVGRNKGKKDYMHIEERGNKIVEL